MIRALLVVDVPFYRDGLQELLRKDGEFTVVGTLANLDGMPRIDALRPDVVLLDIGCRSAQDWAKQTCGETTAPRVVALAVDDNDASIVDWLALGIAGYVSKHSNAAELISVLRAAVRGDWSCPTKVMTLVLRRLSTLSTGARLVTEGAAKLTAREQQILELVGNGLSNKRIAMALRISHATTKNHVHNILGKLQLTNRSQVAAYLNRASVAH